MARFRTRSPSRLPTSVSPLHPDLIHQGIPPVGAHPAWQRRAALSDDSKKERFSETIQGSARHGSAQALQRPRRAGKRHHRRLFTQS